MSSSLIKNRLWIYWFNFKKFLISFSDAPVCSSDVDQLIGVTADESISINCRVSCFTKNKVAIINIREIFVIFKSISFLRKKLKILAWCLSSCRHLQLVFQQQWPQRWIGWRKIYNWWKSFDPQFHSNK